jgi:hypothetical protein
MTWLRHLGRQALIDRAVCCERISVHMIQAKMKKFFTGGSLDRAVIYALSNRVWGLLSSFVMLALIIRLMSSEEQGYYYTFSAILGAQILFELGLSMVVTQFASHAMAKLSWTKEGILDGDPSEKARMRSLVRLMVKWYATLGVVVIVVLGPAGWLFLTHANPATSVQWQLAWAWLIVAVAANLLTLPMLSLLEGCGCVTEITRLRFNQSIAGSIVAWTTLLLGGGLLAMSAWNTALAVVAYTSLYKNKRHFFRDMLGRSSQAVADIPWKTEIWPFQWRIGLSWISGYFIFQLFVPVLFAARGAVEAGKMGLSLAIANALLGISISWLNTKAPKFGELIARRDYLQLDRLFTKTLTFTFGLQVIGSLTACATIYLLNSFHIPLAERLLEPQGFTLLLAATLLMYVTIAQASYLRAHKEEPFLSISLASGFAVALLTHLTVGPYGATGMMWGYLASNAVIGLGWGSAIFQSKRRSYRAAATISNLSGEKG